MEMCGSSGTIEQLGLQQGWYLVSGRVGVDLGEWLTWADAAGWG
jgi:hypothetical protein